MITIGSLVLLFLFRNFCSLFGKIDNPYETDEIDHQDPQLKKNE